MKDMRETSEMIWLDFRKITFGWIKLRLKAEWQTTAVVHAKKKSDILKYASSKVKDRHLQVGQSMELWIV